ncbi:hypothetical protein ACFE04_011324 [Oxalis oulophora]
MITDSIITDALIASAPHFKDFGKKRGWIFYCVLHLNFCQVFRCPLVSDAANYFDLLKLLELLCKHFVWGDESHVYHQSKMRKERFDVEKGIFGDLNIDRGKGVQFPLTVTDRVIIYVRLISDSFALDVDD